MLIPITVLAYTVVEVLRVSLQSMLLFTRASALWLANTGTQFAFSLAALFLFTKVWTGIAGLLVGAVATAAAFLPWFARAARQKMTEPAKPMLLAAPQARGSFDS